MPGIIEIQNEINVNPKALSYLPWSTLADDARIHSVMHDPTLRPLTNVLVPSWKVVDSLDPTEFGTRTQLQLSQFSALLSAGVVDMANSSVRSIAAAIFPAAGPTRTALLALWNAQAQNQSRVAELGWSLTVEEITAARIG